MNGAQEARHVRHRYHPIFLGLLDAHIAMGQLVGVVEEGGHHPTGGQNQVAVDDFRSDDVPLVAQGVGLQVKHLDFVLQELFAADRGEDVPMQRGVPCGVHVVHVGEVGRRQLGGHRRALHQGDHRQHHAEEGTRQGRLEKECRLGRHGIFHIKSCNARKTDQSMPGFGCMAGPSLVLLTCGGGRRPDEIDDLAACATTKDCGTRP